MNNLKDSRAIQKAWAFIMCVVFIDLCGVSAKVHLLIVILWYVQHMCTVEWIENFSPQIYASG